MCKSTKNLTLTKWREAYYNPCQQAIFLDTQDGVWMIENISPADLKNHILTYGTHGIDWHYVTSSHYDKKERRSFSEKDKVVTVSLDDWVDHYIDTHHRDLLDIPE